MKKLLCHIFICLSSISILSAQTDNQLIPGVKKIKDVTIYKDSMFYSAFPSVIRLSNGEILVAFRRAPNRKVFKESKNNHLDPNSYLVTVRSKDGVHWSKRPELLYAHPFGGSQDPCLLKLKDGTILCASYLWSFIRPEGLAKLPKPFVQNTDAVFSGGYLLRSHDDGKTWSEFKSLGLEKPKEWEKFYASPTVGIQLSNGILAVPYILMNGSGPKITLNANAIVYSADFGKTWKITAVTPDTIIANETTIAEYAPNQIMINARGGTEVHWGSPNPGRRVFVPATPSKSDRKDWHINEWKLHESDKQLIEPICNASFIACQYGKHHFGLFSNPHTTGKERKNLMLQVSSDFTHWTKVGLLTPFNRVVYGYCSLNYQNGRLSFVFEDKECGILYTDLTPFMDEILTKMAANKIIYQQD